MEIEFIGLHRHRTDWSDYEKPKAWEHPAYLLTFSVRGCAAPLQEVIDVIENLEGLTLDQCGREDDRYLMTVEAAGEYWRPAVKAVTEGKAFFSPAISKTLAEDYMRQMQDKSVEDSYDLLTPSEKDVLQLLAEGKTNKEVATILNLSLYTVETHRGNIFQKLNLHSGAELILYAVRKGVIR